MIACVAIIAWAMVQITDQPAWLIFLLSLFAPSGVIALLIKAWRFYIRTRNRRLVELEKAIDKDRSSSGLEIDGGSPDEF